MKDPRQTFAPPGPVPELEAGRQLTPKFDAAGTIAAITTDADTGEVLMFAWMNAEALALTIETGVAHFYSRSRKRLWKKGEESGNLLDVVEMRADCDQDAIWLRVRMQGHKAACHTGHRTCFYRRIPLGRSNAGGQCLEPAGTPKVFDPASVYASLANTAKPLKSD